LRTHHPHAWNTGPDGTGIEKWMLPGELNPALLSPVSMACPVMARTLPLSSST
jgi:hypothetical protein